jgi:hypothetical protein
MALSAPEAKSSLTASTSFVARVTRRPTGVRRSTQLEALEERKMCASQVGHRARPGDLHRVHLRRTSGLRDDEQQSQPDAVAQQAVGLA